MNVFKQTIDNDIIPIIKAMIIAEDRHLLKLRSMRKTPIVCEFIENSEANLRHLETRLREYENYCLN